MLKSDKGLVEIRGNGEDVSKDLIVLLKHFIRVLSESSSVDFALNEVDRIVQIAKRSAENERAKKKDDFDIKKLDGVIEELLEDIIKRFFDERDEDGNEKE